MREMKDSGIEWIGEIPVQWNLVQTKRFFTNTKKIVGAKADNYDRLALTLNGVIKRSKDDSEGLQPEKFEGYQILCKNELVFKLIDLENVKTSRVGLSPYTGLVSPAYIVLSNNFSDNRFFYHWFMSMYYNEVFNHLGGEGVRSALNAKDVLSLPVPDIQLDEQRRIADYLDRKCSQIDDIIARQQAVIEKLKAYKLSVITEAVTKGLNPNVSMKDSGVEWIGEVPEHWDFRRIKNCCLIVDCKNRTPDPDPDGEYIVVRTTCIRDGSFSYEGSYHTNAENFKEWTAKGQPQYGDIFFTREAPMGEACLVPDADNLCMGQRVMFFRPLDGSDPRYILYSIYGPLTREYIDSKNKGSTVGHLKLGQVASLPLFYCPPKEQSEIADYLDKRCGAIDKVVDKKTEIISKLTDYKKSLIYEVVTGKKEV